jgi:hypothetical protein
MDAVWLCLCPKALDSRYSAVVSKARTDLEAVWEAQSPETQKRVERQFKNEPAVETLRHLSVEHYRLYRAAVFIRGLSDLSTPAPISAPSFTYAPHGREWIAQVDADIHEKLYAL